MLFINALRIPVSQDGVTLNFQLIGSVRPAASMKLRTSVRGHRRIWSVRTIVISRALANQILALLISADSVNVSGVLIGSTVACIPLNISWTDGPLEDDVQLSFELHEEVVS